MKKLHRSLLCAGAFLALLSSTLLQADQTMYNRPFNGSDQPQPMMQQGQPFSGPTTGMKVGIVNTKKCLDESKLGKQEQANFTKMKEQMETILQEKERALEEIESKLSDDDYIDSISPEAESELKRKKRTIRQEGMQLQNQYLQTLQQANYKIVQKLTDVISKASEQVAQEMGFDIILNDEACTYYGKHLDVSDRIVAKMNLIYDAESKDSKNKDASRNR